MAGIIPQHMSTPVRWITLEITFEQHVKFTLKIIPDLLLCQQLGIVTYLLSQGVSQHGSEECSAKSVRISSATFVHISPRMSTISIATLDNNTGNGSFIFL